MLGLLILLTGWFVWHSNANAKKALKSAGNNNYSTTFPKKVTTEATQKTTSPPPAPSPSPSPSPVAASTKKSSPSPAPSPAPIVFTPSIVISGDGCEVTAKGSAGFSLFVEVYTYGENGGEFTQQLPDTAVLSVRSGGIAGMIVHAQLKNTSNTVVAEKYGDITAVNCF